MGPSWAPSAGDGAGWAWAAESKRAPIKIDRAGIVGIIVPPLLMRWIRRGSIHSNGACPHPPPIDSLDEITPPAQGTLTAGIGPVGRGTRGCCPRTIASATTATMMMASPRIRRI
jgi:hypothetical protein